MNPSNAQIPPTLPSPRWIRRRGSDWPGRTIGGSWDITAAAPGRNERFVSKRIRVGVDLRIPRRSARCQDITSAAVTSGNSQAVTLSVSGVSSGAPVSPTSIIAGGGPTLCKGCDCIRFERNLAMLGPIPKAAHHRCATLSTHACFSTLRSSSTFR